MTAGDKETRIAARLDTGHVTNNVAELTAALIAAKRLRDWGCTRVLIQGDSDLVVKWVTGVYRCRAPHLQSMVEELRGVLAGFSYAHIEHIYREHNALADALANKAHP